MRVQARQTYVFCHAALIDPEPLRRAYWRDAGSKGFAFLQHYWQGADRGWAKSATPAGGPLDTGADMYDQAFVLFACAWYFQATQDPKALEIIAQTMDFIDRRLKCPAGEGYLEGLTDAGELITAPRRQNPHMHLLEAMLALYQATGDRAYLRRGADLVDLFRTRFFDTGTGMLGECFSADWKMADGPQGQVLEPGHHFEWCWILHTYANAAGDASVRRDAHKLFEFAQTRGVSAPGLAYDELDGSGAVVRAGHRLWPQTETLKALIATAENGPDARLRDLAQSKIAPMAALIFDYYIISGSGVWHDHLDASRNPVSTFVPATSLYHLFLAFAETLRFYDANKSI